MNHHESFIEPFCNLTKVPVTYFNMSAIPQWDYCPSGKICTLLNGDPDHQCNCRKTLISSANMAAQLGEPYIFLCRSGLINIAIASIVQGRIQGAYIAGPIPMGNNRETIIKNIIKGISLAPEIYPKLVVFLSQMRIFTPKEVSDLASLFNNTVLYSLNTMDEFRKIKENYKEESHFGEQIQKYKKLSSQLDYPHELEDQLSQKVKMGDVKGAQKILTELLDKIFIIECGDLSFIKVRVLGICAVLTRHTSKKDALFHVSSEEVENLYLLNQAQNFKDLCRLTAKICENLCASIANQGYRGNSSIVTKACQYINENYKNKITLKIVADELFVNLSYLSALFKKEMGKGFTEYINDIRLRHTQDLLENSNLSLMDISIAAGFDCQSYFTKVFKNKTGITPSEYRKIKQSQTN